MSDHVTPDQLRERLRELGGELDRSADDLDLWYFWNNVFVTVSGVVHLVLAALAAGNVASAETTTTITTTMTTNNSYYHHYYYYNNKISNRKYY